jgi:hypothetical protein
MRSVSHLISGKNIIKNDRAINTSYLQSRGDDVYPRCDLCCEGYVGS